MLRALCVLFVLPMVALAAPVPKERPNEKLVREFGTPVDPDKDCSFSLDGTKLKVTVPAGEHNFVQGRGLANAPRIARSVDGDFVAQVRIRAVPGPTGEAGGPSLLAQTGIYFAADEKNFAYHARSLEVQQGALRLNGRHGGWVNGGANGNGSSGGGHFSPETVYFRVIRTGAKTLFAASVEGTGWHQFGGPDTAGYPEKVTLGLFVTNSSKQAFTVEFDEFTVTPTK